jgi:hypothetical protein
MNIFSVAHAATYMRGLRSYRLQSSVLLWSLFTNELRRRLWLSYVGIHSARSTRCSTG